jgi:hypothetical protein
VFEKRFLEIESRTYPYLDSDLWEFDHVISGWVCVLQSAYVQKPRLSLLLAETTASFRPRGAALFFAILINAFGAALEVGSQSGLMYY